MSRVGGIANVTPARYDDADQSVKRLPTDRITSARTASSLPHDDAVSPIVSPASGCVSSIAPLPFQVVTTGAPRRSARAVTSGLASARDGAAARHDHRSLCVAQQGGRPLDVVGRRSDPAACLTPLRLRDLDIGAVGLDVHRQIQQDGSRPARQHLVPGPVEDERQVVDPGWLPPLLDDRLEDPRIVRDMPAVEFLEQAGSPHVGVDGAGHERDGGRVHVRGRHADDGVRRAGADAREGQDRSTSRAIEAVGEVHGRLLVHDLDRPDLIPAVEQRIGQGPAPVTRDAGHDWDALADQVLDHDLGSGQPPPIPRLGQRPSLRIPRNRLP